MEYESAPHAATRDLHAHDVLSQNESMEEWQEGRIEALMMEEWNGHFRLLYICLYMKTFHFLILTLIT